MHTVARKPVTAIQYIAELNQRLWQDPAFCEGMEFKLYPDGKIGPHMRNADAVGNASIPTVFGRIEAAVEKEFEVIVPVQAGSGSQSQFGDL